MFGPNSDDYVIASILSHESWDDSTWSDAAE
jgi:hypothetical protein